MNMQNTIVSLTYQQFIQEIPADQEDFELQNLMRIIREAIIHHEQGRITLPMPVPRSMLFFLVQASWRSILGYTGAFPPSFDFDLTDVNQDTLESTFSLEYYADASMVEQVNELVDNIASQIVENIISEKDNSHIKLDKLCQWVQKNIERIQIDTTAITQEYLDASSVKGALLDRKASCDGFARALCLLCRKAGIECYVVDGELLDARELDGKMRIHNGSSMQELVFAIAEDSRDPKPIFEQLSRWSHAWNLVIEDEKEVFVDLCGNPFRPLFTPIRMSSDDLNPMGYFLSEISCVPTSTAKVRNMVETSGGYEGGYDASHVAECVVQAWSKNQDFVCFKFSNFQEDELPVSELREAFSIKIEQLKKEVPAPILKDKQFKWILMPPVVNGIRCCCFAFVEDITS